MNNTLNLLEFKLRSRSTGADPRKSWETVWSRKLRSVSRKKNKAIRNKYAYVGTLRVRSLLNFFDWNSTMMPYLGRWRAVGIRGLGLLPVKSWHFYLQLRINRPWSVLKRPNAQSKKLIMSQVVDVRSQLSLQVSWVFATIKRRGNASKRGRLQRTVSFSTGVNWMTLIM